MKNILCYGDSNTFGVNPSYTGTRDSVFRWAREERWTGILQKKLGNDYYVIEEGLGGRTTAWDDQTVAGRNGLTSLLPVLQSHEPLDLVIIMLGTNDTKAVYNASVMEIGRGIEAMIKVCLDPYTYDVDKIPEVLIVSPVYFGKNFEKSWIRGVFDNDAENKIKNLAPELEKISTKYGCGFVDAATVAEASDIDSVHMDRQSHERLAEELEKKIKELL